MRRDVHMAKRRRRPFTPEFKADMVRLVREGGRASAAVARDLDLTETALRGWVRQTAVDSGQSSSGALTTAERAGLAAQRRIGPRAGPAHMAVRISSSGRISNRVAASLLWV